MVHTAHVRAREESITLRVAFSKKVIALEPYLT
jgi:hypothetical protein